jgi:hypothetical protein
MDFFMSEREKQGKFDNSISKRSDVDDLINWANQLPDDIELSGSWKPKIHL